MKQTQTHVWSLAGEEAVSYSLARGKAAAVTRESGEVLRYEDKPAQPSLDTMRGARALKIT